MSLKLRLNLLITLLLAGILLIGAVFSLHNARQNAIAEIRSAEKLVRYLLEETTIKNKNIQYLNTRTFNLQTLGHMRHLRITLFNAQGKLIDSNITQRREPEEEAPRWFIHLMNRLTDQWQSTQLPVYFAGQLLGNIVVTPDPSYEYAEKWKQLKALMSLGLIFFILVNLMVSWVVSLALKPTEKIYSALNDLEAGDLDTRLPPFKTVELARIGQKFNEMVAQLQSSIQQNHRLSQQLMHLQEEERKSLARDLHDEFGQCLTAINTDATIISRVAAKKYPEIQDSAAAISQLSKHLIEQVRGLLQTLRPGVLEELGLSAALEDLLQTWQKRYSAIRLDYQVQLPESSLSDPVNIGIYRLLQEALTNISKHAQASTVMLRVQHQVTDAGEQIYVHIQDNGIGLTGSQSGGMGLPGMQERVTGLGGKISFLNQSGTTIQAWIPMQ